MPTRQVKDAESREWEDFWALRDINLEVPQGEAVGIVGRNGAGKSTLLKLMSRITMPTEGRIRLRGRVASLLEVGTGFHPELTGSENIYLNGAILGMTRNEIRRKFDSIVDFAEIEKFLDTPVKRYSSGMYVRLAFAVAAHLEPEILVVDEVLAVGDQTFQRKCLGKMDEVATQEGRTVLFVSHHAAMITALCSRAIRLEKGRLVDDGPSNEVIERYQNEMIEQSSDGSREHRSERHKVSVSQVRAAVAPNGQETHDLDISLRVVCEKNLRDLGIGIGITSPRGEVVCNLPPKMTGFIRSNVEGAYEARARVSRIDERLSPGDYLVSVWLRRPGEERMLVVDNAARFTVPTRDIYGFGRPLDVRANGVVPIKFDFEINEERNGAEP